MEEAVNQLQAELQQIQNQWCANEQQLLAEKQNAEEKATLAIQKLQKLQNAPRSSDLEDYSTNQSHNKAQSQ